MLDTKTITVPGAPPQQVLIGGTGAPLVWLHDVGGADAGDPFLALLAKSHSVTAPVQLGRNDLAELDGIDDIRDLALHYDSLLETLGLDRVTLAGHGFGAMLAAEIAAHVPKRVAKLALIAPLGLWNDAYPVEDLFARPYAVMDDFLWQGATARPAAAPQTAAADPGEQTVALVNGVGSVAKFIWPIPDRGLAKRLKRITAKTVVIFGEQDALIPAAYADDFAKAISGARKLVMKASHMLPYEHPAKIAEAIAAL